MAQLRDSVVDGNLEVTGNMVLKTTGNGVQCIHPETGVSSKLIYMTNAGNVSIGYDGYINHNSDSHIYGEDVALHVGSADADFRPYYRAGDVLEFNTNNTFIRTTGYVTNSSKNVVFTIPLSKPIVGSPYAQLS